MSLDVHPPPDPERHFYVNERQLEEIIERAIARKVDQIADQVEDRFFKRFGRAAAAKLLWLIGLVVAGAVFYLAGKGVLPK